MYRTFVIHFVVKIAEEFWKGLWMSTRHTRLGVKNVKIVAQRDCL